MPNRSEVYVFVRAREGGFIQYRRVVVDEVADRSWTPVVSLPGGVAVAFEPAAILRGTSRILLAVRGVDGVIYDNLFNPADRTWRGWIAMPGIVTTSAPAVVSRDDGGLEYYATAGDGRIYRNEYGLYISPGGGGWRWSGWTNVPGVYAVGGPAAVVFAGWTHVYVRELEDHILEYVEDGTSRGWTPLQGASTLEKPAATVYTDGTRRELHLFIRGYNNRIYHYIKDASGTIDSWREIAGNGRTTAAPAAVGLGGSKLRVFVRWYGDRIYWNTCGGLPPG